MLLIPQAYYITSKLIAERHRDGETSQLCARKFPRLTILESLQEGEYKLHAYFCPSFACTHVALAAKCCQVQYVL